MRNMRNGWLKLGVTGVPPLLYTSLQFCSQVAPNSHDATSSSQVEDSSTSLGLHPLHPLQRTTR
jgi:hypothetical protein